MGSLVLVLTAQGSTACESIKFRDEQTDGRRELVAKASRALLPDPVPVLSFDCTALFLETAKQDGLRQK